jgi:hypothetical protein
MIVAGEQFCGFGVPLSCHSVISLRRMPFANPRHSLWFLSCVPMIPSPYGVCHTPIRRCVTMATDARSSQTADCQTARLPAGGPGRAEARVCPRPLLALLHELPLSPACHNLVSSYVVSRSRVGNGPTVPGFLLHRSSTILSIRFDHRRGP